MRKYAFRRLLQLIPILFAITFLSYGMMRIAGSDVVTQKMENTGQILSEDKLNAAREQLGLDKPFLTQYFVWLGKLLHGDMGNSYVSGLPVFDTFISKLPATLLLTVTSILLTIIISIPLGILSAVKQNTITDYLIRLCSFIGNSLPKFFCIIAVDVFSCNPVADFSGYIQRCKFKECGNAGNHFGNCHVSQVSPPGPCNCAG